MDTPCPSLRRAFFHNQRSGKPTRCTRCCANGARRLIAEAVEAELAAFLDDYADHRLGDERPAVVRNGYLPERTLQTGIGDAGVRVLKVRDRRGGGACFRSALLPPYLKRARSDQDLILWLYLKLLLVYKGVSHRILSSLLWAGAPWRRPAL